MRYGEQLLSGDVDYETLKSIISTSDASEFVDRVIDSVSQIQMASIVDVKRNFLACIKLFKKFEKYRNIILEKAVVDEIYRVHPFKAYAQVLQNSYDRRYPSYASHNNVLIIGHRALEPYDVSKDITLRYQPDYVEIDVCMCRSGHIILQHDRYREDGALLETCNLSDIPNAMTLDCVLNKIKAADRFPPLMIDIKGSQSDSDIVENIIDVLETNKFDLSAVLLASFNMFHLKHITAIRPEAKTALITSNISIDDYIPFLRNIKASMIILDENIVSSDVVSRYSSCGIDVWVYTVNVKGRMLTLCDMGVKGIVTDFPNLIR